MENFSTDTVSNNTVNRKIHVNIDVDYVSDHYEDDNFFQQKKSRLQNEQTELSAEELLANNYFQQVESTDQNLLIIKKPLTSNVSNDVSSSNLLSVENPSCDEKNTLTAGEKFVLPINNERNSSGNTKTNDQNNNEALVVGDMNGNILNDNVLLSLFNNACNDKNEKGIILLDNSENEHKKNTPESQSQTESWTDVIQISVNSNGEIEINNLVVNNSPELNVASNEETVTIMENDDHLRYLDSEVQTSNNKYKCMVYNCNKNLDSYQEMLKHRKIHTEKKTYKCTYPDCPWSFDSQYKLNRHTRSHRQDKAFPCPYVGCGKTFSTNYNLLLHCKVHSENKQDFKCQHCGKQFFDKRIFNNHMRKEHLIEPKFSCNYNGCIKKVHTLAALKLHMKMHLSAKKEFPCPYKNCNKTYDRKSLLKQHIYSHTGERPFKCDICSWGFTNQTLLKRHKETHNDNKKYACPDIHCNKTFNNFIHLKKHLSKHQDIDVTIAKVETSQIPDAPGEMFYICPFEDCGSLFKSLKGAKQHMRQLHSKSNAKEANIAITNKNTVCNSVDENESFVELQDNKTNNEDQPNKNCFDLFLSNISEVNKNTSDSLEKRSNNLPSSSDVSLAFMDDKEDNKEEHCQGFTSDLSYTVDPSEFFTVASTPSSYTSNLSDDTLKAMEANPSSTSDILFYFNECTHADPNIVMPNIHDKTVDDNVEKRDDYLNMQLQSNEGGSARTDASAFKKVLSNKRLQFSLKTPELKRYLERNEDTSFSKQMI